MSHSSGFRSSLTVLTASDIKHICPTAMTDISYMVTLSLEPSIKDQANFYQPAQHFFRKLKVLKFRCFDKSGVFSVRKLPVSFLVFICDSLHRENHTLTVYASSWGSCDSGGRAVIHRSQSYWFDLQFPFIYML